MYEPCGFRRIVNDEIYAGSPRNNCLDKVHARTAPNGKKTFS
jgi:hypothetical protein